MSARLFRLDSFEDGQSPGPQPQPAVDMQAKLKLAGDEGYARGFTDGAARAAEASAQHGEILQSAISEALSDAQITLHSARAAAEADLTALAHAIADTALSRAAATDFAARVCDAIRAELASQPYACLSVKLHPAEAQALSAQMPEGIAVIADADVHRGCAKVCTDSGLTQLNTANVLAKIATALGAPSSTIEELDHDQRNHA